MIQSVTRDVHEVRIGLPGGQLTLRPLSDRAIRVRFAKPGAAETPSRVLIDGSSAPSFDVIQSTDQIVVVMPHLRATVDRASGAVTFRDPSGRVLLAEQPGTRVLRESRIGDEPCFVAEQAFVSPPDERIYGSGQFQDGYLNLRELPRRLTQVNTQIAVPFLLSSKGYGLLWHQYGLTDLNPADEPIDLVMEAAPATAPANVARRERAMRWFTGSFHIDQDGDYALFIQTGQRAGHPCRVDVDERPVIATPGQFPSPACSGRVTLSAGTHNVRVRVSGDEQPRLAIRRPANATVLRSPVAEAVDYVVFAGPGADDVIAAYRQLTGAAPMMPQWALGYIQCRERYHTQQEMLENAAEFRQRQIPVDLIVQDWHYWGKYGWNAMQFDEQNYPDPAAMVRALHEMNFHVMLSVWSRIDPASELGKQFASSGYYIPGTQWVDFFNPDAASAYWQAMSQRLASLGFDAWWQDATEPENDDLAGRTTHASAGDRVRLLYPLMVNATVYNGLRALHPDQRVCILTRSAFAGQQRYAAATWSGDIGSDWETFRRQIPAGLNFVATGQPYWTTDCGGFVRPRDQYTSADYHERLIRWFQYATFCPLQRIHGFASQTEPWRYGQQVEQVVRQYIDLRYRLLPYTYSQAWQVTSRGSTLMRPMVFDFPGDSRALERAYQFMFGPALLVSPVVQPGVTTWDVYLPQSAGGWFDFWTGQHLDGGQVISSSAPLERIPLHVRAGSIIPLGPTKQYAAEKPADPIELRIYGGADATFTLYEDDGVSYAYERGQRTVIPIKWTDATRTLEIGDRVGQFDGMPRERTFNVVMVRPDHGVADTPTSQADRVVRYDGHRQTVQLHR